MTSEEHSVDPKELELFTKYFEDWKGTTTSTASGSLATLIPRFYDKTPVNDDADENNGGSNNNLQQKLREEARSLFLQTKSRELLDNAELKEIWNLLEQHHTPPFVDEDRMINYRGYKAVGEKVSAKAKPFFTASIFAALQQKDPFGRVSILSLFNYIMRKTWLRQSRIGLSLYDMAGLGYLTEKDLELYITELIPTLPHLKKLEESFYSFYVCTAVRRFLFFLDPKRLGRVRIVDILASGFLDDLLELRDADVSSDSDVSPSSTPRFNTYSNSKLDRNWFSATNALRVYGQYLNFDNDRNGMLSKSELKQYGSGMLTDVFIERVFQECLTYEGEMDYKSFLDFTLAMENKKDPSSLQYFFRILDVRQKGYLDAFAINYFFRAIQKLLEEQDQPMVTFEDMKDEIFDMVKPKDSLRIKVQDLVDCGQGDTVVSILADLNGFWTYENRECLATDQKEDEAEC